MTLEQLAALDAVVAEAARRYVLAKRIADDASGATNLLEAIRERDDAYHTLAVAVDGQCRICDAGTCPLDTAPL